MQISSPSGGIQNINADGSNTKSKSKETKVEPVSKSLPILEFDLDFHLVLPHDDKLRIESRWVKKPMEPNAWDKRYDRYYFRMDSIGQ